MSEIAKINLNLSENDKELFMSFLKFWSDIKMHSSDNIPIEHLTDVFDIAKSRLNRERKALKLIYSGDHVPITLTNIMRSFLDGEATQDETEKRLDECTAKLKGWLPQFLRIGSLPRQ